MFWLLKEYKWVDMRKYYLIWLLKDCCLFGGQWLGAQWLGPFWRHLSLGPWWVALLICLGVQSWCLHFSDPWFGWLHFSYPSGSWKQRFWKSAKSSPSSCWKTRGEWSSHCFSRKLTMYFFYLLDKIHGCTNANPSKSSSNACSSFRL